MHSEDDIFDAIAKSDLDSVHRLLSAGASINSLRADGQSVWTYVVPLGSRAVKLALDCGADPNLIDGANRSALYWALYSEDAQSIELLIHAGAVLDLYRDFDGYNVLHEAAMSGRVSALRVLVKHAPKKLYKDRNIFGRTPFEEAVEAGYIDCANLLREFN